MRVTIIIPSYQPDEKLVRTVQGLTDAGFNDIVLVDDGSEPRYRAVFDDARKLPGVTVLAHESNRGKGRSLKTAFEYVIENRPHTDGVVTVDGDGQHRVSDIVGVVQALHETPGSVILGARDFKQSSVPMRSRFGNNVTRAVFRFVCGLRVSDTQTGLRAIPAALLPRMLDIDGERYEYETNQLLVLGKEGIPVREVTIETIYIEGNASSHFHPIKDSWAIYKVIFKFAASSLISFVVDIVGFHLTDRLVQWAGGTPEIRLFLATAVSRVTSSVVNYCINRRAVFKPQTHGARSLVRYYILAICQAAVSYGLVYLVSHLLFGLNAGFTETLVKCLVDLCLFFASFKIQQKWVFKSGK